MNLAERNRGLTLRAFLRAGYDTAFGGEPVRTPSKARRLFQSIVGISALAALAACGSSSKSETVDTDPASVSNGKPAVTLLADKSSVAMHSAATLQWSAQNAQTCVASGGWTGPQPTSGTATTDPLTSTTSYTLTCSGTSGSVSQSVQIAVIGSPVVKLGATPTTIAAGGTSSLSWSAENATTCTGSGGWHGTMATNGTRSTGALSNTTEYELTCTGDSGSATQTATVTVSALPPSITLSAAPSTVNSGGASTLSWSSANATACAASGGWSGNKPLSGSQSSGAITASETYTLTCSGSGGSATQSATVSVRGAAPTVSLSANPSTIASGLSSTLTWNALNATSCTASGAWAGAKPVSGSQSTGALSSSATYVLTCSGPGGSAVQSAVVSIKAPTPTVTLSVGPSSVTSGGSATLNWSATNATSCNSSGSWSGAKASHGSQSTGALTADATYVLTCSSAGGSATQSATVSVTKPAPTISLSASPSSVINGNSSTLTWVASNATSCSASGAWSGGRPVSGSQSTGALSTNATYALSCTGSGGSATQSATVTVSAKPTATISISASPSTVTSGGSSTLTWSSANATSCTASGAWAGTKALSGSQSTGTLTANSTFLITCTGTGGSATQSTTVSVNTPAPTVSFSASPSTVKSGSAATLTWSSNNATACSAGGAWSGGKAVSGTQSTGALTANSTYSLTCSGSGGSATQAATVSITSVAPAPTVTLSANPSTVASGHSSTLSWTSTNATACTASGGWSGSMSINGSQPTAALTANTTYTLSCTGSGGTAAQSATVSVTAPAPTVTLSASPSTVMSGNASMLSWSSANATSCVASQGWSGNEAMTGSHSTGNLTANSTYMLTCTGSGGSASQSTTVTVTSPAPTVTLSASPTTVTSGGTSMLTWSSTNATSCVASGGWSGTIAPNGAQSTTALSAATKYTATCTGVGGSATQSVTVSVAAATPAPTLSFSASPSSVSSGSGTTLNWSASNATTCTASGAWAGNQPTSGSQSTGALSADATYSLSCTGTGGSTQQSVTVTVTAPVTAPSGSACSATSGSLSLKANAVRGTGISPFLVFFDATGTTDSSLGANISAFQGVTYTWNFGDNNSSGTDTWPYGANAGRNSRNNATGGVAAHLYVTPGSDSAYTVTVTANDGTNTASCQLGVTAYEPSGSNGFPGSATACVASSGTPVAGSGGCPSGAAVLSTPSFVTALSSYLGNGKRVLFNCGDTFSGTNYTISATKASIGAYGSCVGTTTNRPVLQASAGNIMFNMGTSSGDIRITDIVFDGGGQSTVTMFDTMNGGSINSNHPYQWTFYNLDARRQVYSWRWGAGAQMGLINSVAEAQTATPYINVFPNYAGAGGSWVTSGTIPNEDYLFFAGNSFTNGASGNASYEVMRDSYGSKNIVSNNTMTNAGPSYATLKFHNLNYATDGGSGAWSGTYTQYDVISDNYFAGSSGANLVEVSPQNAQSDERMRYIVIERNLFAGTEGFGRQLLLSGSSITVRDNVFHNASGSFGVQVSQRGVEPAPQFVQVYNNTCNGGGSSACVAFVPSGGPTPVSNSWAMNNLIYNSGAVANQGSGNTVSNNTASTGNNPGFTNGSGNFSLISDFKPTANYSGATNVPVFYDALGTAWSPTWDLGAVHP